MSVGVSGRRRGGVVRGAVILILGAMPAVAPVRAQTPGEPILSRLQQATSTEGLRLGLLIQAVLDPSLDESDPAPASVQVAAMRIRLDGRLDGGFDYSFQTNFAGSPSILDARVGWSPSAALAVSAGRFKTPFSRELLTYAGSIDFVNRSRVVSQLSPGRQLGVQAGGRLGELARWSAGGFTGPSQPADDDLVGVARLEITPVTGQADGTRVSLAASVAAGRDGAIGGGALGRDFRGDGVLVGGDARVVVDRLLLAGEFITANWDAVGGIESDAAGLYLTAGWMSSSRTQVLARWDRYRAPGTQSDDALILGFNAWPTSATEIQVNWLAPIGDSPSPHKLLVNFQVGF